MDLCEHVPSPSVTELFFPLSRSSSHTRDQPPIFDRHYQYFSLLLVICLWFYLWKNMVISTIACIWYKWSVICISIGIKGPRITCSLYMEFEFIFKNVGPQRFTMAYWRLAFWSRKANFHFKKVWCANATICACVLETCVGNKNRKRRMEGRLRFETRGKYGER